MRQVAVSAHFEHICHTSVRPRQAPMMCTLIFIVAALPSCHVCRTQSFIYATMFRYRSRMSSTACSRVKYDLRRSIILRARHEVTPLYRLSLQLLTGNRRSC